MHRKYFCDWVQRSLFVLLLKRPRCEPSWQRMQHVIECKCFTGGSWSLNCFWLQATNCGHEAVNLLTKVLEINPSKRPSAAALLGSRDVLGHVTPPISVY